MTKYTAFHIITSNQGVIDYVRVDGVIKPVEGHSRYAWAQFKGDRLVEAYTEDQLLVVSDYQPELDRRFVLSGKGDVYVAVQGNFNGQGKTPHEAAQALYKAIGDSYRAGT